MEEAETLKGNDLLREWIKALRSGEYKQAKQVLHSTAYNSYCCLGVLCKVANVEIDDTIKRNGGDEYIAQDVLEKMEVDLDKFEFLDIESETAKSHKGQSAFACMNDKLNKDFEYIANFIENQMD